MSLALLIAKQESLRKISASFPEVQADFAMPASPITHRDPAIWGENAWITYADYALEGAEQIPAFFESVISQRSPETTDFYIEVLASDTDSVDAWKNLGFEIQHVSAILTEFLPVAPSNSVLIRKPTENDLYSIAALERELSLFQMRAPIYSKVQPESIEEIVEAWRSDIHDDAYKAYVAEVDGVVVGFSFGCSTEKSKLHSGLLRPINSATFAFCTIDESFRGQGIGKALASTVIEDLLNSGYENIVTDWRATNPLSSRTWPQLGFIPTFYRMHLGKSS